MSKLVASPCEGSPAVSVARAPQPIHLRRIEQFAIFGPALRRLCRPDSIPTPILRRDLQTLAVMNNGGDRRFCVDFFVESQRGRACESLADMSYRGPERREHPVSAQMHRARPAPNEDRKPGIAGQIC